MCNELTASEQRCRQAAGDRRVLPWDMVDKSTSPGKRISDSFFSHATGQIGCFILWAFAPLPCFHLHQTAHCHFARHLAGDDDVKSYTSSGFIHPQIVHHGTGGRGWHSTSRPVHRRLVLPAAMAGVRWRSRCTTSLPHRGCRLHECNAECSVGAHNMRGSSLPVEVSQQVWGGLRRGPGTTRQRRHPMTDGQIDPLDTCGVEPSREAHPRPRGSEIGLCPQAHHLCDPRQLPPPRAFFHLAGDQTRRRLPSMCFPPSLNHLKPLANMGREGIKVQM